MQVEVTQTLHIEKQTKEVTTRGVYAENGDPRVGTGEFYDYYSLVLRTEGPGFRNNKVLDSSNCRDRMVQTKELVQSIIEELNANDYIDELVHAKGKLLQAQYQLIEKEREVDLIKRKISLRDKILNPNY